MPHFQLKKLLKMKFWMAQTAGLTWENACYKKKHKDMQEMFNTLTIYLAKLEVFLLHLYKIINKNNSNHITAILSENKINTYEKN